MPDASGRFKGISVPAIPWHSHCTNESDESAANARRFVEPMPCGCKTDADMVACLGRRVAQDAAQE